MDKRLILFETLYDTHADAIWRYLYYQLGDTERAQELMQEVFLKTWQYIKDEKTIEYEKAFLYRIARNLFINEIRTKKKSTSLDTLEAVGFEAQDEQSITSTLAEHAELLRNLHRIKESYREVLIMRYIDDLPVKHIASLLNENETTISMRIKRALEALQKFYTKHTS